MLLSSQVFVLVGYLCVCVLFVIQIVKLFNFFYFYGRIVWLCNFGNLHKHWCLRYWMSLLIKSTQCLCLGLYSIVQHDVSTLGSICYLYQRACNKPKHLLRNRKMISLYMFLIAVYSGNARRLVFKSSLKHFLLVCLSVGLNCWQIFEIDLTEICYLCINQLLHYHL